MRMEWNRLLYVQRGVTAIIGSGGKTTLMYRLADELSADGRVIICTTTHIFPPEHIPYLLAPERGAVRAALQDHRVLCVSAGTERGKLLPPNLSFSELAQLADYVLVEADGSHRRPAKAHAPYEPVVPPEAGQTICVFGLSALGQPIREGMHRAELGAQKLGVSPDEILTPELAARLLRQEGLSSCFLLNQADTPEHEALARRLAEGLAGAVYMGSLQKGSGQCLC